MACATPSSTPFVRFLDEKDLELPTHAQELLDGLRAKPDFAYGHHATVVFVDGPPHNFPDVEERDQQATVGSKTPAIT